MHASEQTIRDLRAVWASLLELCEGMDDAQWQSPTGCPGWNVADVVAHLVGTERSLAGEHPPAAPGDGFPAYVRNPIGEFNERWVAHLRSASPGELLAQFREVTTRRLSMLAALRPEEWQAPTLTPAGPGTYLSLMRIRVFDCWAHEQDLRWVLGRPGGATGPWVDTALEVPRAALPKVVARGARAPDGSVVEWVLEGEPKRRWRVVVREGRGALLDDGDEDPTVRLRSGVADFVLRACGRRDPVSGGPLGAVAIDGDEELGQRVVEAMALLI